AERHAARDAWDAARAEMRDARQPVGDAVDLAEAVATEKAKPYLDADLFAEVTGLVDAIAQISESLPQIADALDATSEPDTTEELLAAIERAQRATESLEEGTAIFETAAEGFAENVPDLEEATAELRASIPKQADRLEK